MHNEGYDGRHQEPKRGGHEHDGPAQHRTASVEAGGSRAGAVAYPHAPSSSISVGSGAELEEEKGVRSAVEEDILVPQVFSVPNNKNTQHIQTVEKRREGSDG